MRFALANTEQMKTNLESFKCDRYDLLKDVFHLGRNMRRTMSITD